MMQQSSKENVYEWSNICDAHKTKTSTAKGWIAGRVAGKIMNIMIVFAN